MFDTKTNTKTDPLGSGPVLLYCDYMEWEVLDHALLSLSPKVLDLVAIRPAFCCRKT